MNAEAPKRPSNFIQAADMAIGATGNKQGALTLNTPASAQTASTPEVIDQQENPAPGTPAVPIMI